ncbi:TLDc domain-containing protein [Entamoeba marina]
MKKIIQSNGFKQFKNDLNEVINLVNDISNEVNQNVREKYNLDKYDTVIEGSDEDVLLQYETWYDQLNAIIIKNDDIIKQSSEAKQEIIDLVDLFSNLNVKDNIELISNKEMMNNNEVKKTLDSIVNKIVDKENYIFNKKEEERKLKYDARLNELNQMKSRYDNILVNIFENDTRIQQDNEIIELKPSLDKLLCWSDKQKCTVLFDSKVHGDGDYGNIKNRVLNKNNVCFISFDTNNNVFGGYINVIIDKVNNWINDPNAFTFSLMRNGNVMNTKYPIKAHNIDKAFYLHSTNYYGFGNGNDICVYPIGNSSSYCSCSSYSYHNQQNPFVDGRDFKSNRIIVLQMS